LFAIRKRFSIALNSVLANRTALIGGS